MKLEVQKEKKKKTLHKVGMVCGLKVEILKED